MGLVELHRTHLIAVLVDDLPGRLVAAESHERVEELSGEHERVPLSSAIRRQHDAGLVAAPLGHDLVDHAARHVQLITQQHRHGLSARIERPDPRAIGRGAAVAELRVFDDRRGAEIDALTDLGSRATDDDDDLIEGGRRRGVADDGAQQRGGAEREELLGLAETSRGAGREDEAAHERPPHRRSNVSLQARQQKYTVRSPIWERYLLATSTTIPQIGSVASIESAVAGSGLPLR